MTAATVLSGTGDFADLYAEHLRGVWRYVRARVPDHHESHDVTSDVFVRAWRAWDRFDPERGAVEPWLYTIASRTVADWWRRRPDVPIDREAADVAGGTAPESEVLRAELLAQLRVALADLRPHERDALALRFAARLSMAHIAEVLGTTADAAKMTIHRAIQRLRDQQLTGAASEGPPADLEAVIDEVLASGRVPAGSALHELILAVSAVHESDVPSELGAHVARCVQCAATDDGGESASTGEAPPRSGRWQFTNVVAAMLTFSGVCLVCTVPALQTVVFALGLTAAAYALHFVGLAAAPVVAWLIYRSVRRHGRDRSFRIARAGAIAMGVHTIAHVLFAISPHADLPTWLVVLFAASDWIATPLLVAGAVLNVVDAQRWRAEQRLGLRSAIGVA